MYKLRQNKGQTWNFILGETMTIDNLPENPFLLFQTWLEDAEDSEPNDPNAMTLATADENGQPSARIMLLKGVDERGFVFYTNKESRKAEQLEHNPKAALCFHWKTLRRQVRIEGPLEHVTDQEADEYFASRHRNSQIGAWASKQSRPMNDYSELEQAKAEQAKKFENEDHVPRPPHWGGYRVLPQRIEFWIDGAHRLHKRYLYTPSGNGWTIQMLNP